MSRYPAGKREDEWRRDLSPERYRVLREGATEAPGTGELLDVDEAGMYHCAGCGAALFSSEAKYHSGSGWPSFWDAADPDAIERVEDRSHGMVRTEIKCARCGGHLGHLFDDGPADKTGKRFCVNSASLEFKKDA